SREGVQRDLLPIVEGSTVQTRYGYVRTDHILFIAAGAFHIAKPSDLIPELQGRFPIRVELGSLSEADFVRIMTEPENALTKQYAALVAAEGAKLEFTADGVKEIARIAAKVNERMENIGARRLHRGSYDGSDVEHGRAGSAVRRRRHARRDRRRRGIAVDQSGGHRVDHGPQESRRPRAVWPARRQRGDRHQD